MYYYVYFLKSIVNPNETYVGFTRNVQERLEKHNEGGSVYTRQDRPWKLIFFIGFSDESKARAFEKYLKNNAGKEFAKRRLW